MSPFSPHWTVSFRNTLPFCVIGQPPTFTPPTSQLQKFQPSPHPYPFTIPTFAQLSSQIQNLIVMIIDNIPKKIMNDIEVPTVYQLVPNPQFQDSVASGTIII